jgi:hypothetical protein
LIGVAVPGPKDQLPAMLSAAPAPVCDAAFAPVIVAPTARPAPMTVAAATAA